MDPEHLTAAEEFKPKKLIDCFGQTANEEGEPYVDLEISNGCRRAEGGSPGHFLWKEHKNGYIDLVEKVGDQDRCFLLRHDAGQKDPLYAAAHGDYLPTSGPCSKGVSRCPHALGPGPCTRKRLKKPSMN